MLVSRCVRCRRPTAMEEIQETLVLLKKLPVAKLKGTCTQCGLQQFLLAEEACARSLAPARENRLLNVVPSSKVLLKAFTSEEEWKQWRMCGIGGSDAPSIMGESPWETTFEAWCRKTRRLASMPITYPMKRGIELEREARIIYEAIKGVEMPKRNLQRNDSAFALGSFDGYNGSPIALEIKCPGKEDHLLALDQKIPRKYRSQLTHLCWVGDLEGIDYFSYNPRKNFDGPKTAIVHFKRDRGLEEELIAEETKFWECVVTDIPPPEKPRYVQVPGSNIFTIRSSNVR